MSVQLSYFCYCLLSSVDCLHLLLQLSVNSEYLSIDDTKFSCRWQCILSVSCFMRIFLTRLTFDGSNPINRDCKFHSDIQFLVSALSTVSRAICAAKCLNVCSKAFHLVAIVKVIASNWIGVKRAKYCPRQKQWQRKSVSIAKQSSTWEKIYRKKTKQKKLCLVPFGFTFSITWSFFSFSYATFLACFTICEKLFFTLCCDADMLSAFFSFLRSAFGSSRKILHNFCYFCGN